MTNKEKLKNAIDKDYDKAKYLEDISKKIEKKSNLKNYYKYLALPICIVALISILLINNGGYNNNHINSSNNEINSLINTSSNDSNIKINILKEISESKIKAQIKSQNYLNIPVFEFMNDLSIPEDFDNKENYKAIYIKDDKNNYYLNNYEFNYLNTTNDRKIKISFSDKYEPLRDYYFTIDNIKKSVINGVELEIYKYKSIYIAIFNYKGYNFDIETKDISETEFFDLLASILK